MYLFQIIKKNKLLTKYFILALFLFISSIIFNLFLRKNNITTGGVNGVAIIFEKILHFDPAITIFFFSLILLILSFLFLSKEQTIGNITTTFLYPFFVKITSNISDLIKFNDNDIIVICIYVGVLGGISSGIIYKLGFSNGGLSIINQLCYKYLKTSISKSTFILNALIVVIGGFIFGYQMVLYAIIILYINSVMINKIMNGISTNKSIYIVTERKDKVKDYLKQENISFTIFKSEEAYTEKDKEIIFTTVPNNSYYELTKKLKKIDKNIFFLVTDSYQIYKKVLIKNEMIKNASKTIQ